MKLIFAFFTFLFIRSLMPGTKFHSSLAEQYDGPYVQYKVNDVLIRYIVDSNGTKLIKTDSVSVREKNNVSLKVNTDLPGKTFAVQLKKKLENEKSEYRKVKKLFILSDIEGNFSAFRKLLQANNVVDENFEWKFGEGHLVLVGDFFDRGQQVTEVLWLIYSLEEKAKAAGGYVHFVLGNHEIMNLSGDLRYVHPKYLNNASLLQQHYMSLYDENTELGRWLRTKNIVEKVGDIVFAHGGISGFINRLNLSIEDINKLARPYYSDTLYNYADQSSDALMGDLGPFWYRGYYVKNNPLIPLEIDSTLTLYRSRYIVTGHTLVADTISAWYNGRLFNTDVHHASGKSEALLVEDKKFYRVNTEGKKVLLK